MAEIKHTPLPWRASGTIIYTVKTNERGYVYAVGGCNGENFVEDIKFIVQACNSHYDLLNLLSASQDVLEFLEHRDETKQVDDFRLAIAQAQQALTKTKGNRDDKIND